MSEIVDMTECGICLCLVLTESHAAHQSRAHPPSQWAAYGSEVTAEDPFWCLPKEDR